MAFKGQKRLKKLNICQTEMPELPAGKTKNKPPATAYTYGGDQTLRIFDILVSKFDALAHEIKWTMTIFLIIVIYLIMLKVCVLPIFQNIFFFFK